MLDRFMGEAVAALIIAAIIGCWFFLWFLWL